ncbi:MAG: hypothetical protein HGB32_15185, partial [Geobacteraceae bacterium]|nr:hypothetical protein [Geobacteraceae bacterium]
PAGLTGVAVTYDGSAVAPTNPGSYAVVATLTNDNYQAADATGTLVIGKGTAILTLGGLNQEYNTTPKAVTVTTSPAGLTGVAVTYDGSAVAPSAIGSYAVVATLTNDNYQAADATSTLVIGKGTATLTLGDLTQTYDGTPKAATVTTSPAGLTGVAVTYDGSAVLPTNAGSYAVVATMTNENYQAANATGTLVISTLPVTISWANPAEINNMTPLSITQLNAVASVQGTYKYTPDSGTLLGVGTKTLSVIFTPTDTNYSTVTATVTINVTPVPPCVGPSYLTVPAINTSGSLSFYWGSSSNCSGATFILEQSADNTTFTAVYSGTSRSNVTIPVTTNGIYTYRVKAAKSGYADSEFTTGSNTCSVALKCGAPSYLTVPANNSTGSIAISFGASNINGVTYILEQKFNDGPYTIVYSGTSKSKDLTVTADGTYTYRISAIKNGYADSDYTTTNTCNVALKCGAPSYLTVPANNSTGSIAISFGASDVSGVTYILEEKFNDGPYTIVYSGTSAIKTLTVGNGSYTYRVSAIKTGYAVSDPTTGSNACNVSLMCGAPASLTVPDTNGTGSINVTWGASDVSGATYVLQQSSNGIDYTTVYSGTSLYKDSITMAANGTYIYRVKAIKTGYAESDYTTTNSCSVTLMCGAPSSLTVPATSTTGTIDVSWGASSASGATYVLERSNDNGENYTTVYSGTSLYKYNITMAANGTYIYRVKAIKTGYAESDYTTTNSCSVTLGCGAPTSLTVPATNTTGIVYVTWGSSNVSGVTYTLEQSSDDGQNYTTVYSGTSLYKNNSVPNGTYTYRVKATKTGYISSDYTYSAVSCTVTK